MISRGAQLVRNASLGVSTASAMALEDPVLLLIQAARRAPSSSRARAASLLRTAARPDSSRAVVADWLAGYDVEARDGIAHLLRAGSVASLVAEIGVLLDVPGAADASFSSTRARALARRGDLTGAIAEARPNSPLSCRLLSERAAITPGHDVRPAATGVAPSARPSSSAWSSSIDPPPGPRVLHLLTNSLPHTTSGYALRSHQVLLAQRGAGIDAVAATRVGYPVAVGLLGARDVETIHDVRYHRLVPWRSARTPGARLQQHADLALSLARRLRPDVVHTTTNYANALVARAVARELGVPWVYEVRGVLEDTWVASFPPDQQAEARASERYRLLRARENELVRAAHRVVVLGETVRSSLLERGVESDRIVLAPNAVENRLLGPVRPSAHARSELGLSESGFWVGTVSSLVEYEGIGTLIEAVALARSRGRDVRACIVGDGVSRPGLERLTHDLGLTSVVHLPGRVPAHEAQTWYEAMDTFVLPRLASDVTRTVVPLKPMQAMAAGRPVVASDLPALAEIVAAPGAGLLTVPGSRESLADAIARLADNPSLRERLARSGRAFASTRTWSTVGATYQGMYESMT